MKRLSARVKSLEQALQVVDEKVAEYERYMKADAARHGPPRPPRFPPPTPRNKLQHQHAVFAAAENCVTRFSGLGGDENIRVMYESLTARRITDGQWMRFVTSALQAVRAYDGERQAGRDANKMVKGIEEIADELARRLCILKLNGFHLPASVTDELIDVLRFDVASIKTPVRFQDKLTQAALQTRKNHAVADSMRAFAFLLSRPPDGDSEPLDPWHVLEAMAAAVNALSASPVDAEVDLESARKIRGLRQFSRAPSTITPSRVQSKH